MDDGREWEEGSVIEQGSSYFTEEKSRNTDPIPHYPDYRIHTSQTALQNNGNGKRKKKSGAGRILRSVLCGLLFGAAAASAFHVTDRILERNGSADTASDAGSTLQDVADEAEAGAEAGSRMMTQSADGTEHEAQAETPAGTVTGEDAQTPDALPAGNADTAGGTDSGEDFYGRATSSKGPVAGVAAEAMPSVVAIAGVSIQEIPTFYGWGTRQYESSNNGSGIIVGENDEELLIATNYHVVSSATTLSVCFIGNDVVGAQQETKNLAENRYQGVDLENAVTAKIKGTDEENDLAVIAVQKSDIPEETRSMIKIAHLGNSDDLVVGEQVVAIGNALGYGQSVTSGWVSALDRSLTTSEGTTSGLLQTDAAINPGNSGGALLNMSGELIGINVAKSAYSDTEGMGYAIPISRALPILENLMQRQTRDIVPEESAGYLGVSVVDISRDTGRMYGLPEGVFISECYAGSAAENAGMQRGDIIISLDGQKISNRSGLARLLQYYAAGETVDVVIARAGQNEYTEQTLQVTLGSYR